VDRQPLHEPTGAKIGPFQVGSNPGGIAFDGANMWVLNNISNLSELSPTGATIGGFDTSTGVGIAFDGTHMWVPISGNDSVIEL
jgi:DNA-binding beta-propeller fold protein YncE